MRRRRAERLVLRADAATDNGCLTEAREALAEARQLAPTLPDLERIEQRLTAAEQAERLDQALSIEPEPVPADLPAELAAPEPPAPEISTLELPALLPPREDLPLQPPSLAIVESSSATRRLTAIAASMVLVGAGGWFAFTMLGSDSPLTSHGVPATAQLVSAPQAAVATPAPAPSAPDPLPAVAAVDPTGTTGLVEPACRRETPVRRVPWCRSDRRPRRRGVDLAQTAQGPAWPRRPAAR